MKIGIYLVEDVNPSFGGTFSYQHKLITSLDNYDLAKSLEVCYIGRMASPGITLKKKYIPLSSVKIFRYFLLLKRLNVLRILTFLFGGSFDRCHSNDTKILLAHGIDIIFYPKQFSPVIGGFPFLTVNWDIGHKSTFIFPEFTTSIDYREQWYRSEIQKALGIIVESEASKKECINYLLIDKSKVDVVPLFAGGVIDMQVPIPAQHEFLSKHGLMPFDYFFYPARFWAHKNHYTILIAFRKYLDDNPGRKHKLVFTGDDGGNKSYILKTIKDLGLADSLCDLGFVSDEELYSLYKNTISLVMPTFLGPTNMPVLEALALQTPVICSDLSGHREICQDAALYADPAEPLQWVAAMQTMTDENERLHYIKRGKEVYATSRFRIDHALKSLESVFLKYANIRKVFE